MAHVYLDPNLNNVVRIDYAEIVADMSMIRDAIHQAREISLGLPLPRLVLHNVPSRNFPPGNAIQTMQQAIRDSSEGQTAAFVVIQSMLIRRIIEIAGRLTRTDGMFLFKSLDEAYVAIRAFQANYKPA